MFPLGEDDEPEPSGRFDWLIGPGWLAGHLGLVLGAAGTGALLLLLSPAFGWYQWRLVLLAGGCAWVGAMVGSTTARDEFLREDWESHRRLVGLLSGGIVGGFFALLLCDGFILVGGVVGGALGGLLDAVVHGDILEEGD
jgi:hypothetical protein